MKYLCLVYFDEKRFDAMAAMPKSEYDAFATEHMMLDDQLRNNGRYIASESLPHVHAATTVRVRNGKLTTTDGPFAETNEQLGGFFLIDAEDLNEAIQIATKIPSSRTGSIEVRPIWDLRRHEPRVWR